MKNEILVYKNPLWSRPFNFYMRQVSDGRIAVAENMMLRTLTPEDDGREHQPLFTLSEEEAAGLMNQLWRWGVRPSEKPNLNERLKAIENHLADMRRIAAAKLRVKLP